MRSLGISRDRADVETDFTTQPGTPMWGVQSKQLRQYKKSAAWQFKYRGVWCGDKDRSRFQVVRWPSGFISTAEVTGQAPIHPESEWRPERPTPNVNEATLGIPVGTI